MITSIEEAGEEDWLGKEDGFRVLFDLIYFGQRPVTEVYRIEAQLLQDDS